MKVQKFTVFSFLLILFIQCSSTKLMVKDTKTEISNSGIEIISFEPYYFNEKIAIGMHQRKAYKIFQRNGWRYSIEHECWYPLKGKLAVTLSIDKNNIIYKISIRCSREQFSSLDLDAKFPFVRYQIKGNKYHIEIGFDRQEEFLNIKK